MGLGRLSAGRSGRVWREDERRIEQTLEQQDLGVAAWGQKELAKRSSGGWNIFL